MVTSTGADIAAANVDDPGDKCATLDQFQVRSLALETDEVAYVGQAMPTPILLRDRSRPSQIVLAIVVPFAFGALAGIALGISAGAYWALLALATAGGVLVGFEHRDWRGGARRGVLGGVLFASGLLIAHAIAGADAKASLGSFPPLLIVLDAIVGMLLGMLGGRLSSRLRRSD